MDLKYTTMGSSLLPMNPLVGGIATGVGLGVDVFMDQQNRMDALQQTRDYNKSMTQLQPTIYDQPGGYKQTMPGLKKGGSMKGLAYRSKKPAGHIIPADKVPEAQADARTAGVSLKRIPGQGSPVADDQMLQVPGAEPVRVSSGEAFVSDDEFGDMARMAGMGRAQYQMKLYPNSRDLQGEEPGIDRKATGGTVDWNPPMQNPPGSSGYQPIGFGPQMSVLGQFAQGQTPGLPTMASAPTAPAYAGPRAPDNSGMAMPDIRSMQTVADENQGAGEPPAVPGQTDPAQQKSATMASAVPGADGTDEDPMAMIPGVTPGTQSVTQAGMDDGTLEKGFEDMQDMNDRAAYGQLVPIMLSGLHNLTSRRVSGRPPMAYQPTMLDLNVEGFKADLDNQRQRSVATATNNSRGEQSQSRNLGIGANDQTARIKGASAVEGKQNFQDQANVQIGNDAKRENLRRSDQYEASEANATNQHKLMKGQAFTDTLSAASNVTGGHAQGNIEIGAMKQLFNFQKRMYDTISGIPSSQYATPTSVFTGNKEDMSQPDQTAQSLLTPEQQKMMLLQMGMMYGGYGGMGFGLYRRS